MTDDIDLVKIDKSDADPKVKEVYRILCRFIKQAERKEWLQKRNDCWDAVYETDERSTIWNDKQRKDMTEKGMIPLVINDLYKGVQGSAAIVTDQKPGIDFHPVGSGDLYVAELMKRGNDQVWAQNDGGTEVYEFVKEAKVGGLGVIECRHDPAKGIYGKTVFGNMRPDKLYFDMQKSVKADLSDTHILKAHLVSKVYAKETYDVDDSDLIFEGTAPNPDEASEDRTDTATGVDNYTRADKTDQTPAADEYPEEKEDIWEIEAHLLKREREVWLMIPIQGGGYQRQVFTPEQAKQAREASAQIEGSVVWNRVVEKRVLRIIIGKKIIKSTGEDGDEVDEIVNPYGVDVDGDPVVPIIVIEHDRTRKGKPVSPTVFAIEACRERNKRRAQAIYVVSKNIDAPIVVAGPYKWIADGKHGDVMQLDRSALQWTPQRLAPGSVSTEALNMEAIAKNDIDDMYDMHDVMKGKIPKGDPSGRTILALQDMAGMMSKPFTRTLEASLARLGKVTMAIMLKTWPRSMWERLIEDDEKSTWVPDKLKKPPSMNDMMGAMNGQQDQGPDEKAQQEIQAKWAQALELIRPADMTKPPGISLLDVDVRVSSGSTLPTNRMGRAALAMDLTEKGIYDQEAALDMLDDPNKDQIIARIKAKEQSMMMAAMAKGGI